MSDNEKTPVKDLKVNLEPAISESIMPEVRFEHETDNLNRGETTRIIVEGDKQAVADIIQALHYKGILS